MTPQDKSLIITVCMATCKRPQYLPPLLDKIAKQVLPGHVTLRVVVVDNDPEKSAESVVTNIKKDYPYDLTYGFEPIRGIPFTRNRAVSLVRPDAEFIAFIDDDEYPELDWVAKLLETQVATNADVVQGPVIPLYMDNPPAWIIKGGFFTFAHYEAATGEALIPLGLATNNLLVKRSVLSQVKGPFDETMGLMGCDDTALGLTLHKMGFKMIYTRDALVTEYVPRTRTNLKWILQRAYRGANSLWVLEMDKTPLKFIKLLVGAVVRMIIGIVLLLPATIVGIVAGWQYPVKMLRLIVRGRAIIGGLFGKRYEEYKHAYTTQAAG